jgi:putative phosphoesterase
VKNLNILILSDIHGNTDALKAVLEHANRWDSIWVIGDLVDYGPEPQIVIDMIRDIKPDFILMGNHDYAVAFNVDCRCAPNIHDLSEYTRKYISYRLISRDQIEWLKGLAIKMEKTIEGKKVLAVHGSPRNPLYGYIEPSMSLDEIKFALTPSLYALKPRPVERDIVVIGHSHKPMKIYVDNILVINPGSVGQPRDGIPKASYAVFNTEQSVFEIHRVEYDIEKVVGKLRSLKIEDRYMQWLEKILKTGKV